MSTLEQIIDEARSLSPDDKQKLRQVLMSIWNPKTQDPIGP